MNFPIKNLIVFLVLTLALPCSAKISGNVSKTNFYDTENTLMSDFSTNTSLKTGKYWEKNLFYSNKYRPIFMISNKELQSLLPEKKKSIFEMIAAPAVYNISLKNNSIKTVSVNKKPVKTEAKITSNNTPPKVAMGQIGDLQAKFLFEQAKNRDVDSDEKIDTAVVLKQTKKSENFTLALDLLDDVTRVEPYNAAAYNLKAEIYLEKNDKENAMKNYIEVLNLNPYSKESYLGIAKILEPTNKVLAQKYYERANEK